MNFCLEKSFNIIAVTNGEPKKFDAAVLHSLDTTFEGIFFTRAQDKWRPDRGLVIVEEYSEGWAFPSYDINNLAELSKSTNSIGVIKKPGMCCQGGSTTLMGKFM